MKIGRLCLGFGGLAALGALVAILAPGHPASAVIADADDPALVAHGKILYRQACASCHGRDLQGQPLWQLQDEYFGRRAPAQDESGHTWQHADAALFAMTKFGRFPATPADAASAMPAFETRLTDAEIAAVLAFIKARWPLGLRVAQAMLNPDAAGMPRGAEAADWQFPPICSPMRRHASRAAAR